MQVALFEQRGRVLSIFIMMSIPCWHKGALRLLDSVILLSGCQLDLIVVVIIKESQLTARKLKIVQKLGGLLKCKVALVGVSAAVLGDATLILVIEHHVHVHVEHGSELDALLNIVLDSLILQINPPLLVSAPLNAMAVGSSTGCLSEALVLLSGAAAGRGWS